MKHMMVVAAMVSVFGVGGALAGDETDGKVFVKMSTSVGDYLLELDRTKAPISVKNFLAYVNDGFYTDTIFHRVVPNFVVQGGGFSPNWQKKSTKTPIQNEAANGLKNDYGTIAMARTGEPHSATSQFYINMKNNDNLNYPGRDEWGYCVFGKVVAGIDAVERIHHMPVRRGQPGGAVVVTAAEQVAADQVESVKSGIKMSNLEAGKAEAARKEKEAARMAKEQAEAGHKIAADFETAKAFIASKGADVSKGVKTDSGLWYVDVVMGEGELPSLSDKILTHYTGWFPDGKKFDSSVDRGTPFPVNLRGGVIAAWLETLKTMKQGGKRFIIAPPAIAYGAQGRPPSIPRNSTLIFEIDAVEIQR